MSIYSRGDRYYWRRRARWIVLRINYLLAVLAVAVLLLAEPVEASGQSWDRCWRIPHGTVCVARAAKITRIACDWGYQPRFGQPPRCVALEVWP
jgi:hypothetical protein